MIEFVTSNGRRYRVVEYDGGIGAVVNEGRDIKRTLWSIQGGGFEMLYGGHWIAGKLRVKAGRRVVPTVIELHSYLLFKQAQDAMSSGTSVRWQGKEMEVVSCYSTPTFRFLVGLIPLKDKDNG